MPRRPTLSLILGTVGLAVSWTPVGLLGLLAGIAAIAVGAPQRTRDPAAKCGVLLGAAAVAVVVVVAGVTLVHSIRNGTFERS